MKHVPAVVAAFSLAALTFGLGYKLGGGNEPHVSPSLVEEAQKASFFGADPNWLRQTDSQALF